MKDAASFWISSLVVVILSYVIREIDPLVQIIFGGYLGFIKGGLSIGNPIFVTMFLYALYKILGKKLMDFYIQFFVNANLVWLGAFPAIYLNQYYDIKLIIIAFCIPFAVLAPVLADRIREKMKLRSERFH